MTTLMPSNLNFGKFALIALVSLSGCASQRIYPSTDKLVRLEPNCEIAQEQLDWLRSIRPTFKERIGARNEVLAWGGFSRDYQNNKNISDGKIDWLIDLNIRDIYRKCQKES
jgi:hypothetical protein